MKKTTLAIIVPCYNEELCITSTIERLLEVMQMLNAKGKISETSYIYFVDDGSTDKTWEIISRYNKQTHHVKGTRFVRNYGNQKALLAGLEGVRKIGCDCVVSIDADLQQDEMAIEKFIEKMYDATPRYNGTDTVVSNKLWETVLNNKPDFNVKNYGKENFVELLRDLDIFEMQPDREWPQIYYIFKKGSNKSLQERKRGKVKRRIDKYRIIEDEEGRNFFFYMTEINSDFRGEKLEVGTNVDFKVAKEPNPNGNTNRERNGRATDVKVVDTIGEIARVLSR